MTVLVDFLQASVSDLLTQREHPLLAPTGLRLGGDMLLPLTHRVHWEFIFPQSSILLFL